MAPEAAPAPAPSPPPTTPTKDVGKEWEDRGKQLERDFRRVGEMMQRRYDETFGLLGPLLAALVGLCILIVVILAFSAIAALPGSREVWVSLRDFFATYLLLLFALLLLGAYSAYFARRHRWGYRWVSPLVAGISIVAALWVAARLFLVLGRDLRIPLLSTWAAVFDLFLPVILVLVIVIGYLAAVLRVAAWRGYPAYGRGPP